MSCTSLCSHTASPLDAALLMNRQEYSIDWVLAALHAQAREIEIIAGCVATSAGSQSTAYLSLPAERVA